MVKVTTNYLIRRITFRKQLQVRKKDETDKQYLNRITHLRLQGQFIDQITKITDCQSVLVIYLQNNLLKTIHNMESFPNLIHLYLQRNLLAKIENLEVLTQLRKIYLGYNEILVLEGLDNLFNIVEVHIEGQNLPLGETLYFEPRTMQNLAESLLVLNVSNNHLTTLNGLSQLTRLEILIAEDNLLSNLADLSETLKYWPFLRKLSLTGNVVTCDRKYRDSVIFHSKSLEFLDDKEIHENTRKFIEKLYELRQLRNLKEDQEKEVPETRETKSVKFVRPYDNFVSIPQDFPDTLPANLYPAWKLRKNVNSLNQRMFLPRPYWKKLGLIRTKPPTAVSFEHDMTDYLNFE